MRNRRARVNNTSTFNYDPHGHLQSVVIADGRPRTVSFVTDNNGLILARSEADANTSTGDPHELHYYFNGIQLGDVSNNGTSDVDYAASIAMHTVAPGTGPFRYGSASNTPYADFDQSLPKTSSRTLRQKRETDHDRSRWWVS